MIKPTEWSSSRIQ